MNIDKISSYIKSYRDNTQVFNLEHYLGTGILEHNLIYSGKDISFAINIITQQIVFLKPVFKLSKDNYCLLETAIDKVRKNRFFYIKYKKYFKKTGNEELDKFIR